MKTFTLLAALAVATASNAAGVRESAMPVFKQVDKAFMHKDAAAFKKATMGRMTSDFKEVNPDGTSMTYAQTCDSVKQMLSTFNKVTSADVKMLTVKEKGNAATSTCAHTLTGTVMGPDKKSHKMVMKGWTSDTWKKEGKVWKMASMTWTKQEMTLDGKPFRPGPGSMSGNGH